MENRYLFRGRRTDNNEWVQGYLFQNGETTVIITEVIDDGCTIKIKVAFVVEPETIGLYINLKDKNSKMIFEGDILNIECYSYEEPEYSCFGVIEMGSTGFGLRMLEGSDIDEWEYLCNIGGSYITEHEICGNIYDNPKVTEE